MKGFARALRGEAFLWRTKRSVRWAHFGVAALAAATVAWGRVLVGLRAGLGEGGPGQGAWNFWPQFAGGARAGFFLVELLSLILIAGSLPREIGLGAARDPLVRGISRSAFVAARACIALLLPLTLALCAVGAAAGTAALLFDAGDVLEGEDVLISVAEDGLDAHLRLALLHGLPPLFALAAVGLLLSALLRHPVAAVGAGLMLALAPRLLHDPLGAKARWFFPDTLAGLGADSYLERIALFAQGYSDAFPMTFDAVIRAGWIAPWPALALAWIAAVAAFARRAV